MKVKTDSELVPGAPKVGTELVLKIFRFGKFGISTEYHLLISEHGFHRNNIIPIQHFWLIFFRLYFSVFFIKFRFILVIGSVRNALVVISKHISPSTDGDF
ncbi:hypothetical protein Hanom_Chr12g01092551 [Helianthus anomalus]